MCAVQDKYNGFEKDQRRFFDQLITEDWATYKSSDWDYIRNFEVRQLFKCIGVPKKILDIGCGCGYHDQVMADFSGVEQVIGIDYSKESIKRANQEYSHHKVKRLIADVFSFPGKREFDLVASFQVIEHLENPIDFLRSCADLIRPKGWIAVFTPNRTRLNNYLRQIMGKKPQKSDVMHFKEYSQTELIQMGGKVGLKFYKTFSYGLEFQYKTILFPRYIFLRVFLGRCFPGIASSIAVIYQKPC